MSIFSSMDLNNVETSKDTLGGTFERLESDIYPAIIKTIYLTSSKGGAKAANIVADVAGKEYREQLWITNSKGEGYYVNKKTGNKVMLPGLQTLAELVFCGIEKELKDLDTQERVFKVYDYDLKQEVNKPVETIIEMMGMEVDLAIVKEIVDKNVKNESTGAYEPSGETREQNAIEKVFHRASRKTANEAKAGDDATYYDAWLKKNKGVVRNKAKGVKKEGTAGAPQKVAEQPRKSLFS